MYESKLLALITEGENERLEFKRELNLSTVEGKCEFIKDVSALANSTSESSYLIIGVDDNKQLVGIQNLQEERIQQIISTYINPTVVLRCFLVPVTGSTPTLVGVIEVRGKNKPYKVSRSIEKLNQNDVFVRHGTVVLKASPEEIISLDHTSRLDLERKQLIRSAEAHARIHQWQEAIDAYAQAINLMPTFDALLARARTCQQLIHVKSEWKERLKLGQLALKDLSGAIELADSLDVEKEIRLEQLRLCVEIGEDLFEGNSYVDNLNWLKTHTMGRELGEVLYLDWELTEAASGIKEYAHEAVQDLDKAIELGYQDTPVYALRSIVHFFLNNYGLALQDVDVALRENAKSLDIRNFVSLRINILVKMKRFDDAYAALIQARGSMGNDFKDNWGYASSSFEGEMIHRWVIAYEFDPNGKREIDKIRPLFQSFLLAAIYNTYILKVDLEQHTSRRVKATVANSFPKIAHVIRKIVGEDFWEKNKHILE